MGGDDAGRAREAREHDVPILAADGNEAVVAQVRGYHAPPWAEGDPEAVIRTFVCECGDPACEASVDVLLQSLPVLPCSRSGAAERTRRVRACGSRRRR